MTNNIRSSTAPRPRVIGVITSSEDLDLAIRMRRRPDLFELRLDHLVRAIDKTEKKISRLYSPLIITARHPQEGGANGLSLRQRCTLLSRFLPHAEYLDIELRSVPALRPLLAFARKNEVRLIASFHDFKSTPGTRILRAKVRAARVHGANIFKIATRTDTPLELGRLIDLVSDKDIPVPVSAMGIGELGAISRVLLARAGSALVYGSVSSRTQVEGQLSLGELRALGIEW